MSTKAPQSPSRFRVLVPIWGDAYVAKFCQLALPALLADGNLPALARRADCELVVLTTQDTRTRIERDGALAPLAGVCGHSFIAIDDLLAFDEYGAILTVAYGRGMASLGRHQQDTAFIFLNADFIFSDGLLSTVLSRLDRGFRAVMAPSLRCIDEEVATALARRVSPATGKLSAAPADLVRLALDHLHPTAAASVVNRTTLFNAVANQFFWQVDDATLLGRYFLMFMLCIRPEVPYPGATGWCDYAFVPEMVPSGHWDVVTNSDDGFILELQDRESEAQVIQEGKRIAPESYAPRLSFWTTDHHRRYAARDVVFRAGDWPASLPVARQAFGTWMNALLSGLSAPATSHRDHPFWTRSIERQKAFFAAGLPPEFPAAPAPRRPWWPFGRR